MIDVIGRHAEKIKETIAKLMSLRLKCLESVEKIELLEDLNRKTEIRITKDVLKNPECTSEIKRKAAIMENLTSDSDFLEVQRSLKENKHDLAVARIEEKFYKSMNDLYMVQLELHRKDE